jgi:cleavage stimulation factor subunit 3
VLDARVVFEKSVDRLLQKPETAQKAKALFAFFHRYESQYGELDQIIKLEKRMREAFPEDPRLSAFSQRYVTDHFDPAAVRPIISPMTQARPKLPPMPSIEQQHERPKSLTPVPPPAAIPAPVLMEAPPPVPQPLAVPTPPVVYAAPVINSPKRPFPVDDFNPEPPRKLARGESPLAGAAGRRLNQAKQSRGFDGAHSATPGAAYMPPPPPIPRDVLFLLSIIPPAHTYNRNMEIDPRAVLRVMNDIQLPPSASMLPPRPPTAMQQMQPAQVYQMPPGQYPGKTLLVFPLVL